MFSTHPTISFSFCEESRQKPSMHFMLSDSRTHCAIFLDIGSLKAFCSILSLVPCRLFTVLSPGCPSPTVPIDMAIRICLASSPPVRSFIGNLNGGALLKHCEPLRPCLSASVAVATTPAATAVAGSSSSSPTWKNRRKKNKKNVVFADCLGLALTAVHVFDEAEENLLTELQFQLTEIEGAAAGLHLGEEAGERHSLHTAVGRFREQNLSVDQ